MFNLKYQIQDKR